MHARVVLFSVILTVAGCAHGPEPPAAGSSKPAVMLGVNTGGRMEREESSVTSAAGSAAAQETVRRLQANDPRLSVATKSRFKEDPEYRDSLTGSVILQSETVQRSSASFASYRVSAIEIHALPNGRVRVWCDFNNASKDLRVPRVYCRFNDNNEREVPVWQTLPRVKPSERRLVFFDSKDSTVSRVTVLIR